MSWPANSYAADKHPESPIVAHDKLKAILQVSGINTLYADLAATVLSESSAARLSSCDDAPEKANEIQTFLEKMLNVDQMMDDSVEQVFRMLKPEVIEETASWISSETGEAILHAESLSANWSVEEFDRRELALANDPAWNDERKRLIADVIDSTAVVQFVTAFHSETSALVMQAGNCLADDASRIQISNSIEQARNDEAFYGVFLRNDMYNTAALIFSEISDSKLRAYVEHNRSAEGMAWNRAILSMVRQILRNRHEPVLHFLASLGQE